MVQEILPPWGDIWAIKTPLGLMDSTTFDSQANEIEVIDEKEVSEVVNDVKDIDKGQTTLF